MKIKLFIVVFISCLFLLSNVWAHNSIDEKCVPSEIHNCTHDFLANICTLSMQGEITEALDLAHRYMPYYRGIITNDLIYRTPAQPMREAADALDRRDSAFMRIKEIKKKWDECRGAQ